jgi:N-acetyl sugar amidotransferase
MKIYNEEELKKDPIANFERPYQQCSISVMDTIADPDITFDENGICNYYYEYLEAEKKNCLYGEEGLKKQIEIAMTIKNNPGKNGYDCILGLSGGADSTYLAYLAKKLGLNPLLVHFDYGWNTEIAVQNVKSTVNYTGFDLHTFVMDWEEFKNLQRSYFKASVLDLDVPADHMIFGSLYNIASKYKIKYILSGNNIWTEHTLPKSWNYNKFDLINLKNIHKKFENTPLNNLPALGYYNQIYYNIFKKINYINFIDYEYFNRESILKFIESEMGWINYGAKHQESVFTRFYQGYILPTKFHIDKRKAHLSNLIFSKQLSKQEALQELRHLPYPFDKQRNDFEFVAKKLGFTFDEFDAILNQKNVPHDYYGTDRNQVLRFQKFLAFIRPVTAIYKRFN